MKFAHSKNLDYTLVTVDRDARQRKTITGIDELVGSIRRIGLINPIIVDDQHKLMAGERRWTAWGKLYAEDPKKWGKIPVRLASDLTEEELILVELEENIKRHQLDWKDECLAVLKFARLLEAEGKSNGEIATALGLKKSWYHVQVDVGEALEAEPRDEPIWKCDTATQANNILVRRRERAMASAMEELDRDLIAPLDSKPAGQPKAKSKPAASSSSPQPVAQEDSDDEGTTGEEGKGPQEESGEVPLPSGILNTDFTVWASSFVGPKFNFLHCDFPYGINHQDSDQGGSERWGSYNDSPETYYALCECLADNLDKLLYPSAHVMFWFSMNYYEWTRAHFTKLGFKVNPNPLIWHKTDNKGIISDAKRTPRHVYETALIMSRGDRWVISNLADTYGAPTGKATGLHLSEKSEPMLRHFMQMFVDHHTSMLDPTCGSGSALRAAESLGASRVLGLERDPEFARAATTAFESARRLRNAAKKGAA